MAKTTTRCKMKCPICKGPCLGTNGHAVEVLHQCQKHAWGDLETHAVEKWRVKEQTIERMISALKEMKKQYLYLDIRKAS